MQQQLTFANVLHFGPALKALCIQDDALLVVCEHVAGGEALQEAVIIAAIALADLAVHLHHCALLELPVCGWSVFTQLGASFSPCLRGVQLFASTAAAVLLPVTLLAMSSRLAQTACCWHIDEVLCVCLEKHATMLSYCTLSLAQHSFMQSRRVLGRLSRPS